MKTINEANFHKAMDNYFDLVADTGEAIAVTRENQRNVVIISKAEYDNYLENQHVLENPTNRAWLDQSIAQVKSKKFGK